MARIFAMHVQLPRAPSPGLGIGMGGCLPLPLALGGGMGSAGGLPAGSLKGNKMVASDILPVLSGASFPLAPSDRFDAGVGLQRQGGRLGPEQ